MTGKSAHQESEIMLTINTWCSDPAVNEYFLLLHSGKAYEAMRWAMNLNEVQKTTIAYVGEIIQENDGSRRDDRLKMG